MKKIGWGALILLGALVAAVTIYGYAANYNIVKVLMVELAPDYSFNQIVKGLEKKETEHITWYYPSEVQPPEKDMADMEKAYMDACGFWEVDPLEKLGGKIRFVWLPGENRYDMSRIQKAMGKELQGRSLPKEGILYSIFSYTPHELNHVVAGTVQNTTTLLDEGFANYLNKIRWDSNVQQVMEEAKKDGLVIPLKDLLTHKDFRSQDSRTAYAEAALFVKYLVEEKDPENFKRLYREVSFFDSRDEVMTRVEEVYGQSFSEFEGEWESYLESVL